MVTPDAVVEGRYALMTAVACVEVGVSAALAGWGGTCDLWVAPHPRYAVTECPTCLHLPTIAPLPCKSVSISMSQLFTGECVGVRVASV